MANTLAVAWSNVGTERRRAARGGRPRGHLAIGQGRVPRLGQRHEVRRLSHTPNRYDKFRFSLESQQGGLSDRTDPGPVRQVRT